MTIDTSGDLRFWRIADVIARVGLSKSEIYRRQKDVDPELNPFPRPRHYKRDDRRGSFYLSTDIRVWQLRELGLSAAADIAKLLG
jgi:predicted DNA-binding transcriptional regulator AlpA